MRGEFMITAWIMKLNVLWLRRLLLFVVDNWKALLIALAAIIVFVWILNFSFCSKPSPKIDEKTIQEINSKNEAERREALQKVFDEVDTERQVDDAERKQIEKRIDDAKKYGKHVTADELERLIEENK